MSIQITFPFSLQGREKTPSYSFLAAGVLHWTEAEAGVHAPLLRSRRRNFSPGACSVPGAGAETAAFPGPRGRPGPATRCLFKSQLRAGETAPLGASAGRRLRARPRPRSRSRLRAAEGSSARGLLGGAGRRGPAEGGRKSPAGRGGAAPGPAPAPAAPAVSNGRTRMCRGSGLFLPSCSRRFP